MKIWKDREGNWITAKEFGQRWKAGIQDVRPIQQTRSQLVFTMITLIGIMCGVVVTALNFKSLWWLCIILVAAFGNTGVAWVGIYQKYTQLKKSDDMIKGGTNE